MLRRGWSILVAIIAVASLASWLLLGPFQSNSEPSVTAELPKQAISIQVNEKVSAVTDPLSTSDLGTNSNNSDKTVFDACFSSDRGWYTDPEAFESEKWLTQLGMRTALTDRGLHAQTTTELERLVAHDDVSAMLALGVRLHWESTRAYEPFPTDEGFLIPVWPTQSDHFDRDKLELARAIFYEAALRGQVFALSEISHTYSTERQSLDHLGRLTEVYATTLSREAALHGEMAEELIPGLHEGFFDANLVTKDNSFNQELRSRIEQYDEERHALGLEPLNVEIPDAYYETPDSCD